MRQAARKGLAVWLIRLVAAALLLLFLSLELLRAVVWAGLLLAGVSLLLLLFFGVFYLPAYYRRYSFALQESTLRLVTGVFVQRVTVVPYAHMILMTRLQTALTRLFGVCMAMVTLPGGRLWIACLTIAEAERLSALTGGGWDEAG